MATDGILGRPSRAMSTPAGLAGLVLSALAVAGCGVSASVSVYGGGSTLSNPDKLVSDGLAAKVGQPPVSVSCPSDVPATVGNVFHCKVVINSAGQYVTATVTETSINGNTVKINIVDGTTVQ